MMMTEQEIQEALEKGRKRREKYYQEFKEKMDTDPRMKTDEEYRHKVAREIKYREMNDPYD